MNDCINDYINGYIIDCIIDCIIGCIIGCISLITDLTDIHSSHSNSCRRRLHKYTEIAIATVLSKNTTGISLYRPNFRKDESCHGHSRLSPSRNRFNGMRC